ncbi:class B sortase [Oceanobacillus sp. Castelsardo]|uniref:class B sortase n=1 Tax=Oceanobacillus sp. Castelsardo TaxID=1851204 RepID=UPI0008393A07|nr:class B sortase [Oceanobacillus sp. Castelsardo]
MILIFSIIGIIYSIYSIITYINEYRISEKKYDELKVLYDQNEANQVQELKRLNEDYVGWVTVDGSEINYPVVHGEDNDFYLTHNFYKEEDKVGAIFMDYRNPDDSLEPHTIIYGHNMKDNSMFGSLSNVLESEFSKDNPIKLDFQNQTYEWEIFSAYVTRETDWMQIDFESTDRYFSFIRDLKNKSNVDFSKELKKDDKILTLATCTSRVSDERVVVHARLIKGE